MPDDSPADLGQNFQADQPTGISGLRSWAETNNLGKFDHFQSDEDFAKALVGEVVRSRQPDPGVQRAIHESRRYQELQSDPEYQEWDKGRKAKREPPAPEYKPPDWDAGDYDQSWEELMIYDPNTRSYVLNPHHPHAKIADPSLPIKFKTGREKREARLNDLITNFPKHHRDFTLSLFKDPEARKAMVEALRDDLRKDFGDFAGHRDTENAVTNYLGDPQSGIFQRHPETGQALIDPNTGEPALSEKGQLAYFYAQQARSMLGKEPKDQLSPSEANRVRSYVVQMVERDMALGPAMAQFAAPPPAQMEQPEAEEPAPARNARQKRNWLKEAADEAAANRGQGIPTNRVANNGHKKERSFSDMCNDTLKGRG